MTWRSRPSTSGSTTRVRRYDSYETDNQLYQELRCMPITKFLQHVVYYKPLADGVIVIRVLHGARDVDRIFGQEDDLGEL